MPGDPIRVHGGALLDGEHEPLDAVTHVRHPQKDVTVALEGLPGHREQLRPVIGRRGHGSAQHLGREARERPAHLRGGRPLDAQTVPGGSPDRSRPARLHRIQRCRIGGHDAGGPRMDEDTRTGCSLEVDPHLRRKAQHCEGDALPGQRPADGHELGGKSCAAVAHQTDVGEWGLVGCPQRSPPPDGELDDGLDAPLAEDAEAKQGRPKAGGEHLGEVRPGERGGESGVAAVEVPRLTGADGLDGQPPCTALHRGALGRALGDGRGGDHSKSASGSSANA